MSIKIGVILGSTRPQRAGAAVAEWFKTLLHDSAEVQYEFIDLADINLPFLDEPVPPLQQQYSKQHTKDWSARVASLDGYIVITPEYNHSFPAVLKNAFDFVYHEWARKPIGFVSYGAYAGGARAVEQLRQVAVELQMAPVRAQVLIPAVWSAFEDNKIKPEHLLGDPQTLLDDVIWWAKALQAARNKK